MTKKTPVEQIQEALSSAKKLGWSPKTIRALEALVKVVKRGGAIGIVLSILLEPDEVMAGEEELLLLCKAAPVVCKQSTKSIQ